MSGIITDYPKEVIVTIVTIILSSTGWLLVFFLTAPGHDDIMSRNDIVEIVREYSSYDDREKRMLDGRFNHIAEEIERLSKALDRYQSLTNSRVDRIDNEIIRIRIEIARLASALKDKGSQIN